MAGFAHSVQAPFRGARMSGTLAPVAGLARLSGSVDDSALARRAAAGDGDAFAALYEIPESATPMGGGVGGGGTGFDPGDPEDDPERNVLLEARNEEIRAANLALPERQREVLALRELEEDSNEAGWLTEHLMHCHTCRLGRDAMQEAGVSYRAWAPIAAGPLLFRETMAQAAEHVGADWSETIARHEARRAGGAAAAAGGAAGAGAAAGSARAAILRHRRRDLTLIGVLTCLLVLVVLVGAASDDDPVESVVPAADEEQAVAEEPAAAPEAQDKAKKKRRDRRASAPEPAPEPVAPAAVPVDVADLAPVEEEDS